MSNKNKRRPARPHWEKVKRITPNGAETVVPGSEYHTYYGSFKVLKKGNTKKAPGQ